MRFTFILRLLCLTGLVACSIAVAVARSAPRPSGFLLRTDTHTVAVNGSFFRPAQPGASVLDTATGALAPLRASRTETLQWPTFSSWCDMHGERQVVGIWAVTHGSRGERVLDESGLARVSHPSGRVLDRITDCPLPRRAPCWYPGPKPRVLFAATDGRLYQCAFDTSGPPVVKAVRWSADSDRYRHPYIESVIWPDAPVLRGGAIAVVNWEEQGYERGPFRLWSIKLSPDGTNLVAASPIPLSEPDDDRSTNWNAPSVHQTPQGDSVIAWLRFPHRSRVAELLVAPLRADARTGEPTIATTELRKLGEGLLAMPPAFSPDARWIYGVQDLPGEAPAIRRFSLTADAR